MRILRVAQRTYPEVAGGGAYHVHAMSRDQAAMGHEVTVLTIGEESREQRDGYRVVRYPPTVAPLGNEVSLSLARYLRRAAVEFDIVHAHSHLYFSTNLAALLRRLGGPPLAITNHGLYSQTAPESVFDAYLRTVGRWTFDSANVIFCYTDEDRRRLRELGVNASIAVVPNGIDTSRFTPEGPLDSALDVHGPVVLFVGRLVDGKQPEVAVSAFAEVHEQYPNATLVVAGEGPCREQLESRVAEAGLDSAVRFLGHVAYDRMPTIYRSADVLLLPSRAEGLPRTVLEALASGVPVVVSDLPVLEKVVAGAGITVDSDDTAGFALALDDLLSRPERREEYGRVGRERVAAAHDWKSTVARTTEALERVARGVERSE
jgi:glycogen(starch) synthase